MGLEFNFSELEQKLLEIGRKAAKEYSDEALKAGGEVILKAQKITVPVDTGKLKNSLIVGKISGSGAKRKILVGINPAQYEQVKYGFYQEHGTSVMLGKKWMKKSWQGSVKQASQEIGKSLAANLGGG